MSIALTQEARVNLAIKAIYSSKKLSMRSAAQEYRVPLMTLSGRIHGRAPKAETRPPT